MKDELPLPEWPKPHREEEASAEVASFDPVTVREHRESAEFRVPVSYTHLTLPTTPYV